MESISVLTYSNSIDICHILKALIDTICRCAYCLDRRIYLFNTSYGGCKRGVDVVNTNLSPSSLSKHKVTTHNIYVGRGSNLEHFQFREEGRHLLLMKTNFNLHMFVRLSLSYYFTRSVNRQMLKHVF